jgi:hypothetical protein
MHRLQTSTSSSVTREVCPTCRTEQSQLGQKVEEEHHNGQWFPSALRTLLTYGAHGYSLFWPPVWVNSEIWNSVQRFLPLGAIGVESCKDHNLQTGSNIKSFLRSGRVIEIPYASWYLT